MWRQDYIMLCSCVRLCLTPTSQQYSTSYWSTVADLLSVLRVSVQQIQAHECHSASHQVEVTSFTAISSHRLAQNGCGSSQLRLAARAGQTLNISLIDLTSQSHDDVTRACTNYFELQEDSSLPVPVCAGTSRKRHIMTSHGNQVSANFQIQDPKNQRFILTLERKL